jgi:hypothetical protein
MIPALAPAPTPAPAADDEGLRLFTRTIRPALVASCYPCHSAQAQPPRSGLRLDSRDGLRRGGTSGPIVEPNRPDDSLIVRVLEHTSEVAQMPPNGKLPDATVSAIRRWIALGAPHPDDAKAPPGAGGDTGVTPPP